MLDVESHVALKQREVGIPHARSYERDYDVRRDRDRDVPGDEISRHSERQRDACSACVLRRAAQLRQAAHRQAGMQRVGTGIDFVGSCTRAKSETRRAQFREKPANGGDDPGAVRAFLRSLERLVDERLCGQSVLSSRVDDSGNRDAGRRVQARKSCLRVALGASRSWRCDRDAPRAGQSDGGARRPTHRPTSPPPTTSAELGIP